MLVWERTTVLIERNDAFTSAVVRVQAVYDVVETCRGPGREVQPSRDVGEPPLVLVR